MRIAMGNLCPMKKGKGKGNKQRGKELNKGKVD